MNTNDIEKLIDKYFEAQTSITEENTLKQYFTSGEVANHLVPYKSFFSYLNDEKKQNTQFLPKLKENKSKLLWLSGIAASIIAIFSINFYWQQYQEYRQAEQAMTDTKMALKLIADHFNKGNQAIAQLDHIENTKNKILRISNNEIN